MRKLFAMLLSVVVFIGCASGPIGKLQPIIAQELCGEVTVIRISSIVGAMNSYTIILDGKDIFGIRSGQYTNFKLNEGEYYIGVKCFGGFVPTWKKSSVKFIVAPNSNSYFLVSPSLSCASIKSIDESEAQKRVQDSKYVGMLQ